MIVGITGKIGSGKSTIAQYLVDHFDFEEYSFAKPLKQIGEIFGFSQKQLYGSQQDKLSLHPYWKISAREFLQKVGTDLFRQALPKIIPEIKDSVWVDLFKISYKNDKNYVISDVRFLNEAQAIKEMGGIIIKTERFNTVVSTEMSETKHLSENELETIPYDFIIDNNKSYQIAAEQVENIINLYKNECSILQTDFRFEEK